MMPYNIVFTTAEDIVGVVDAILARPNNCTKEYISDFADISSIQTDNALLMAKEFNLVKNMQDGTYYSDSFLARLIVSSRNDTHKAAIMRLILEQYEPFVMFKVRHGFTGSMDAAAKQIRSMYSMTSSYKDIRNTIINIGTYSRSLINDGASSYKFNQDDVNYIEILELALKFKSNDDNALVNQLGEDAFSYVDRDRVFSPLSEAYSKIQNISSDKNSIILYAGNAFESFLQQIADDNQVSLQSKNGISAKTDALSNVLSKKHRGMIQYVIQIRNAADHGADPDENGKVWSIADDTAQFVPLIVANLIKDIVSYKNGKLVV